MLCDADRTYQRERGTAPLHRWENLMNTRSLGSTGPHVSAIGLGCMRMSGGYGPADKAESMATISAALGAGISLLDTGDY